MEAFSMVAEKWLRFYGLHTIETSLFIVFTFALDRLFRLDTKLRYALLVLALIKAFIPPLFTAPQQVSQVVSSQIFLQPIELPADIASHSTFTLPGFVFLLWLSSAIGMFVLVFRQNFKLRKRLKNAKWIFFPKFETQFSSLAFKPELYASSDLQTPLIRGFFQPKLYLPETYKNWPRKHLHSVIVHEVAHLESRDAIALALQTLALILFGLNPLIWFLHRRILHVRELRCDEIVIQKTGITPVDYSKLLYNFLEMQTHRREILIKGAYFAQNKKTILSRFKHLLSLPENGLSQRRMAHFVFPILTAMLLIPFSWQCDTIPLAPENLIDSPAPSEQSEQIFVAYDQAPEPIGGFAAIQRYLQYP
ncbi:MAG: M56 family metallopeptidase, partial [bacterium]